MANKINIDYSINNSNNVRIGNNSYSQKQMLFFYKLYGFISVIIIIFGIITIQFIIGIFAILMGLFILKMKRNYKNIYIEMKNYNLSINQNDNNTLNLETTFESKNTSIAENTQEDNLLIYKKYTTKFEEMFANYKLKWNYSDIKIAGVKHRDINYSNLEINESIEFQKEPNNIYDPNAIKVYQNNIFLGYIHKGQIQEMLNKYLDTDDYFIYSKLNLIDEENKMLQIQLAFYKKIKESDYKFCETIKTNLIKTSKKSEEYETSRQDALSLISQGDYIKFEYQYDSECYLVVNDVFEELGELNKSVSNKLREYIENYEYDIIAQITEITESDNGKYGANIEIKILK